MSNSLPRENVYICQECGRYTVTVDVDDGVTPFLIGCRASGNEPECDGLAASTFYPSGPRPSHIPPPRWEWYKPTPKQLRRLRPSEKEHCKKGGLLLRARTDRAPIMHKEKAVGTV